jgi:hypothetical protein
VSLSHPFNIPLRKSDVAVSEIPQLDSLFVAHTPAWSIRSHILSLLPRLHSHGLVSTLYSCSLLGFLMGAGPLILWLTILSTASAQVNV